MSRMGSILLALCLVVAYPGWAQLTDPEVLHFGPGANTGLTCSGTSTDAALGCGLDPNPIPVDHFDIYVTSAAPKDVNLLYLILGVPLLQGQATPGSLPDLDRVVVYNPYPGPATGTDNTDRSSTFCNLMTSSGVTEAYSACGLSGANNSNNWPNWSGADQQLGINAVKFALFEYNLASLHDLGGNGLYDIFMKAPLPVGTMAIAFGCASGTCFDGSQCTDKGNGDTYATPFTEAGQTVPEPASFLMLGGALIFFAGLLRKTAR